MFVAECCMLPQQVRATSLEANTRAKIGLEGETSNQPAGTRGNKAITSLSRPPSSSSKYQRGAGPSLRDRLVHFLAAYQGTDGASYQAMSKGLGLEKEKFMFLVATIAGSPFALSA